MSMTLAVKVYPDRTRLRLCSSPRRAAWVFLGIAPGWGSGEVSLEGFRDHIGDVVAVDGYRVISSSGEEMRWKAERLGLEVEHMPYMQQP